MYYTLISTFFLVKPAHGHLNEYSTTNDFIIYTPVEGIFLNLSYNIIVTFFSFLYSTSGYSGTDSFSYKIITTTGSQSNAACIDLMIEPFDEDINLDDAESVFEKSNNGQTGRKSMDFLSNMSARLSGREESPFIKEFNKATKHESL